MLESEARVKWCPFMPKDPNAQANYCWGSTCMGWEEWRDITYKEGTRIPDGNKPRDPPEGHCGMIPPEPCCGH